MVLKIRYVVTRNKRIYSMIVVWGDVCYNIFAKSTHDRVVDSYVYVHRLSGIHSTDRSRAKTVALMTAFEIISIFIGILTLLCAFGSLVIALLCLSQQEKDKAKIKMPILPDPQDGRCP